MMTPPSIASQCGFPGCEQPPEERDPGSSGRPREYCADPSHTRATAWRERRRLDKTGSAVTTEADIEQPATMARVTGREILDGTIALADKLAAMAERLRQPVATIGDPDAAEAEMETVRTRALEGVAQAEAARARAEQRAQAAELRTHAADAAAEELDERRATAERDAETARQALADATDAWARDVREVREDAACRITEADERASAAALAAEDAVRIVEERADAAQHEAERLVADTRAAAAAETAGHKAVADEAMSAARSAGVATRAAERRAEVSEAAAAAARAEAVRVREDAQRALEQVRADAERERGEIQAGYEQQLRLAGLAARTTARTGSRTVAQSRLQRPPRWRPKG